MSVLFLKVPHTIPYCYCCCCCCSYSKEWEVTVRRLGRWIDFENDYKTLDPSFMESVWCVAWML